MTLPFALSFRTRAPLALLLTAALVACDADVAGDLPPRGDTTGSLTGGAGGDSAGSAGSGNGGDSAGSSDGDSSGSTDGDSSGSADGDSAGSIDGNSSGSSGEGGEGGDSAGSAGGDSSGAGATTGTTTGTTDGTPSPEGDFAFGLPDGPLSLTEGGDAITVPIELVRTAAHGLAVALEVSADGTDADDLELSLGDTTLAVGESETTLSVALPIGPRPRRPGDHTVSLVGIDTDGASIAATVDLTITPTDRPDIYLLAGQSNMIGSPLPGARMFGPGEPDAPNPRIRQLNVTVNDRQRFPSPAAYRDPERVVVPEQPLTIALDPLHDPLNGNDTKSETTIGPGLSFAKRALADTTAEIVLVPSAWSDTGFCRRDTNRFDGATGWNPTPPASDAFAGTLLYDRAVLRTNIAIAETGGILRGILWHQGEADSDEEICARAYAENLAAMVAALRTEIDADVRGAMARRSGEDAEVPFVVGTMSKGADARGGALAPGGQFGATKAIVDGVHQNVASIVPLSAVVVADDLVPPSYPCGQGDCIHFGAEALRELGVRYYDVLDTLLTGR